MNENRKHVFVRDDGEIKQDTPLALSMACLFS